MTGRLTETEDERGQEAAPIVPLLEWLSSGCLMPDGSAVSEVQLTLADGRIQRFQLPTGTVADASNTRQRVLDKLAECEYAVNRQQLARMLKLKTWKGRFGTVVSAMVDTGEILERDGFLANVASKFTGD